MFPFEVIKMLKNNINFQYHINHILRLVFLEKASFLYGVR